MRSIITLLFLIVSFNISTAQIIGKIFNKDFANKEFGEVVKFIEIDNNSLTDLTDNAGEYIMFNIETGVLKALDNHRNSVLGEAISEEEVFYKMSTSQVRKLIELGNENITRIETRPKTLTLTNGEFTLELTIPCPPYCGN
jgi:hypothetical protein